MAEAQSVVVDAAVSAWLEGGCPFPLAVNEKDGSVLVYVPAGEFEMGDGQGNDCSPHRVELSAYWIGVYCVTNAQYLGFVEATGHRAPDQADGDTPVWQGKRFPPEKADHPVVCISWDDAVAYANWAGGELPTEAQWEKAARGPLGLIYPWGKDWDGTKCRHSGNKGSETTARVYDYPSGVSGYGTYNQSGNVWEWCADWYGKDYYYHSPARDPRGPETGSDRVARGGSWRNDALAHDRAAHRGGNDPGNRWGLPGFSSREGGFLSPCLPIGDRQPGRRRFRLPASGDDRAGVAPPVLLPPPWWGKVGVGGPAR